MARSCVLIQYCIYVFKFLKLTCGAKGQSSNALTMIDQSFKSSFFIVLLGSTRSSSGFLKLLISLIKLDAPGAKELIYKACIIYDKKIVEKERTVKPFLKRWILKQIDAGERSPIYPAYPHQLPAKLI